MTERPKILSMDLAEAGATPEILKATETIVALLQGFPRGLALSAMTNATAMILCHLSKSETAAVENTKSFRKEIERCIRVNFAHFRKQRERA